MRNQPNVGHQEPSGEPIISDKKARREARKLEAKLQKKALKKQRK
jgi:hypothetical protein